jgi:hypothetical protein
MTEKIKETFSKVNIPEKHYCKKCGRELEFSITAYQDGYDTNTGEPVIRYRYFWRCPKASFFTVSHTEVWSRNKVFSNAIPMYRWQER